MIEIILLTIMTLSLFILYSNHPIYCLFCLILTFINFSVLLLLFNLEFLALSYVIVYVGAICVLFIFVILLLNIRVYNLSNRKNFWWLSLLSTFVLLIVYLTLETNVSEKLKSPTHLIAESGGMLLFGKSFFNYNWQYVLLSTLLLLLAVISTIAVSLKRNNKKNLRFDFFY